MSAEPGAKIKVAELFAGVGGFRLGLERKGVGRKLSSRKKNPSFQVVWSNQYEPKTTKQHASDVYVKQFKLIEDDEQDGAYWDRTKSEKHVNIDINEIEGKEVFNHDLLVAGFPCQDYSVMRAMTREERSEDGTTVTSGEAGIDGPRGELWWQIEKVLNEKKPKMVFLENVPRLLTSPAIHKGRNFAVVIRSLIGLGYDVEWRTINAADYGMPQSRNRIFILGYQKDSLPSVELSEESEQKSWLIQNGPFAKAFRMVDDPTLTFHIQRLPETFGKKKSFFTNAGIARVTSEKGEIIVTQLEKSEPYKEAKTPLEKIIVKELSREELEIYSIPKEDIVKWRYLKSTQRNEFRIKKTARDSVPKKKLKIYDQLMAEPKTPNRQDKWNYHKKDFLELVEKELAYRYDIGAMRYPDHLDQTSRTIVTSEGGRGPARTRHIIECRESPSAYRRLMPIELERLNQFPDNWTVIPGISDSRRGFLMGNALVVGVVERLAGPIAELFRKGAN